jgi:hypothetical protein
MMLLQQQQQQRQMVQRDNYHMAGSMIANGMPRNVPPEYAAYYAQGQMFDAMMGQYKNGTRPPSMDGELRAFAVLLRYDFHKRMLVVVVTQNTKTPLCEILNKIIPKRGPEDIFFKKKFICFADGYLSRQGRRIRGRGAQGPCVRFPPPNPENVPTSLYRGIDSEQNSKSNYSMRTCYYSKIQFVLSPTSYLNLIKKPLP